MVWKGTNKPEQHTEVLEQHVLHPDNVSFGEDLAYLRKTMLNHILPASQRHGSQKKSAEQSSPFTNRQRTAPHEMKNQEKETQDGAAKLQKRVSSLLRREQTAVKRGGDAPQGEHGPDPAFWDVMQPSSSK